MRAIIYKYSLTDKEWCDNRTVEDFADETGLWGRDNVISISEKTIDRAKAYTSLLSGKVYVKDNSLYALSKSAIEEYMREL